MKSTSYNYDKPYPRPGDLAITYFDYEHPWTTRDVFMTKDLPKPDGNVSIVSLKRVSSNDVMLVISVCKFDMMKSYAYVMLLESSTLGWIKLDDLIPLEDDIALWEVY